MRTYIVTSVAAALVVGASSLIACSSAGDEGASTENANAAVTSVTESPVTDQGQTGNCWLYATAGWVESLHATAEGELGALLAGLLVLLGPLPAAGERQRRGVRRLLGSRRRSDQAVRPGPDGLLRRRRRDRARSGHRRAQQGDHRRHVDAQRSAPRSRHRARRARQGLQPRRRPERAAHPGLRSRRQQDVPHGRRRLGRHRQRAELPGDDAGVRQGQDDDDARPGHRRGRDRRHQHARRPHRRARLDGDLSAQPPRLRQHDGVGRPRAPDTAAGVRSHSGAAAARRRPADGQRRHRRRRAPAPSPR